MNSLMCCPCNFYKIIDVVCDTLYMVKFHGFSIPPNRGFPFNHARNVVVCSRVSFHTRTKLIIVNDILCFILPVLATLFSPYFIMTISIMYKYIIIAHKVGMTIFNLEVEDLNGLVQLKKTYASDSCRAPVFGVDSIVGCKISCDYPTFALDLEGMCFGTPDALAVNVKFNQAVDLMDGGRENLLFGRFPCDVVNAGNGIANLNGFDRFLAELTGTGTSKLYHM